MDESSVCASLSSDGKATYIEIVEFCFRLKEKLINEQFRIHVKQSSLHTKTTQRQHKNGTRTQGKPIINFIHERSLQFCIIYKC